MQCQRPEPGPGVRVQWAGLGAERRGSLSLGGNHHRHQGKPPAYSEIRILHQSACLKPTNPVLAVFSVISRQQPKANWSPFLAPAGMNQSPVCVHGVATMSGHGL